MKRFWIFAGALAVTLGALTLAMLLGSASFDFRRYTVHRQRLQDGLQFLPEPQVQHLVRFIQHHGAHLNRHERVLAHVVQQASRSGHHNVRTTPELALPLMTLPAPAAVPPERQIAA